MSENIKDNITRCGIWLRLLFMIILTMAYGVAGEVPTPWDCRNTMISRMAF